MYSSSFDKIINTFVRQNIIKENSDSVGDGEIDSIQPILQMSGIYDIFDKVKSEGFSSTEFLDHLNQITTLYKFENEVVPEDFKMLYYLAGFLQDTKKTFKSYGKIRQEFLGDTISDRKNSYFCDWYEEFSERIGNKDEILKALIDTVTAINPTKIKLYQVLILKLFLRRLTTFKNKGYVQSRFLDTRKYPKDEVYYAILKDVGWDLFGHLNYTLKPNKDLEKADPATKTAFNELGDFYDSFLNVIRKSTNTAIEQLLSHNATSPENPVIPGPRDRNRNEAMKHIANFSDRTEISHTFETMATGPKGHLYIGPLFFDDQFNSKTRNTPIAEELAYFKTIVAHEAMHQILHAFDTADIFRFMDEKYVKIAKNNKTAGLFHTLCNIIMDCYLNSALEQWHFKIKPEWYTNFYFPKNGRRDLKFDILQDSEGLKHLNSEPNLKIYLQYVKGGAIQLGFPKEGVENKDPSVFVADSESHCIGFVFPLFYEDMLFSSKKKKDKKPPNLEDPPPGPPGLPQDPPDDPQDPPDDPQDPQDPSDRKSDKPDDDSKSEPTEDDVKDYLDKMQKVNGQVMDEESHTPSGGGETDDDKKPLTQEERNKLKQKLNPILIKKDTYQNILQHFLNDTLKIKKVNKPGPLNRPISRETGGPYRNQVPVIEKDNPDVDSIVIAIDTSGSISEQMIRSFLSQAYSILFAQDKKFDLVKESNGNVILNPAMQIKESELLSFIPIFWTDVAYYPSNVNNLDSIKFNSVNFKQKLELFMSNYKSGGTNLTSVVPKYMEIQKVMATKSKKLGGIIYFTDLDLYERDSSHKIQGIVAKIAPAPVVKIITFLDPTKKVKDITFVTQAGTRFNPENDIIFDDKIAAVMKESYMITPKNLFKIGGKLYKDL